MAASYKQCKVKGCRKKAEKSGYCREHRPVKSKVKKKREIAAVPKIVVEEAKEEISSVVSDKEYSAFFFELGRVWGALAKRTHNLFAEKE